MVAVVGVGNRKDIVNVSRCESARQGCGLINLGKGLGIEGDGIFVGFKDDAKGGNGSVLEMG